jgi:hypothetical protein
MSENQQQALLDVLAAASPSLRYVCIRPWAGHAIRDGDCYWEIVRMNAMNEVTGVTPTFRLLSRKDGERLWEQWEDADE